ncbi:MAG: T9SS type A sorting domain-containing protein [Cytophagaceae bacterium]
MKHFYILFILLPFFCHSQQTWTSSSEGYNLDYGPNDIAINSEGEVFAIRTESVPIDGGPYHVTQARLFKSIDQGDNWSLMTITGLPDTMNYFLTFHGSDMYAGAGFGIYKSTDNGYTWNLSSNGFNHPFVPDDMAIKDDGTFFVLSLDYDQSTYTTSPKVYTSSNGEDWSVVSTTGLPDTSLTCLSTNGSDLFMGIGYYIYKSSDNGANWSQIFDYRDYDGYLRDIAIDDNGNIYVVLFDSPNSNNIVRSSDNGQSWTQLSVTGLSEVAHNRASRISTKGNLMFIASEYGIYKSTDFSLDNDPLSLGIFHKPTTAIFPNPANSYVSIPEGTSRVKLLTTLGIPVFETHADNSTIDISRMEEGIYILQGLNADGQMIFSEKLIIKQ